MKETVKFDMADTVKMLCKAEDKVNCVATAFPEDYQNAMAYVPFQLDKTAYAPEKALDEGSLFVTLNRPFCGRSLLNE